MGTMTTKLKYVLLESDKFWHKPRRSPVLAKQHYEVIYYNSTRKLMLGRLV